jgi:CubicO group peptidase (beta-lactamase class C family)
MGEKLNVNSLVNLLIASLILLVSCQPRNSISSSVKSFPERLDSLFATVPDFSGVVLVARKGKPIYHKAFGYLDFETKSTIDTASIFELASVSKQFTAMLIMMLKEEGKLNYDDPVEKYLTGLPYAGITIRHALNHTGGLPEYETLMREHWDKTKVASNRDILKYLALYHPAKHFEPGAKYEYSNTGYVLLGSIVEKVSGRDFVEFCRERIFAPAGMTDTDLRTPEQKRGMKNFALGHRYVADKSRYVRADSFPETNYVYYLGNRRGPGRISSTSTDLLKWDRILYTDRLVKKETLEEAFTPSGLAGKYDFDGYGFGWMTDHDTLGRKIRHSGDNPGYNTHILRYVDIDRTVILLCNNQHKEFKKVLRKMEELYAQYP